MPLLEAMTFDVPIIAYDACAVPETLGGAGVVVDSKNPVFLSKVIDGIVTREELRSQIIQAQRERLQPRIPTNQTVQSSTYSYHSLFIIRTIGKTYKDFEVIFKKIHANNPL